MPPNEDEDDVDPEFDSYDIMMGQVPNPEDFEPCDEACESTCPCRRGEG